MEEEEEAEKDDKMPCGAIHCILPGSAELSVHAWAKEDGKGWHPEVGQKVQTDPRDSQAERKGNSDCKTARVNYKWPPLWQKHLCEAIGGKGADEEGRMPCGAIRCILPGSAEQSVHAWVKEGGSCWHPEGREKVQTDPEDSQAERIGNGDCKAARVTCQRPPPWQKHLCEAIGGIGAVGSEEELSEKEAARKKKEKCKGGVEETAAGVAQGSC